MRDTIRQRLEKMSERFEEVGRLLAAPEVAGGSQQFRDLSMEYSRLQPLAERFGAYRSLAGFGPFGGNSTYNRKIDVQLRFTF